MNKHRLLLVEDDLELAELTADFFRRYEFECDVEHNGARAIPRILSEQPDLLILDLMLPDMDGMEICRQVKGAYQGKLIMLTARTDTIDQVVGLELGADDYIPKPVEPRLLLAKARAVLRRDPSPQTEGDKPERAPVNTASGLNHPNSSSEVSTTLQINHQRREVYKCGQRLELTTPEYDLLTLLEENTGNIVSRDDIFQSLRGMEYDGQNRQVDILISHLRAKLEDDPTDPKLIKTVRSKGYLYLGNANG